MEYPVELQQVTFSYPDEKKNAIRDITLKVGKGETIAIAGEAGAGKSTLLRCINGLVPHFFNGEFHGTVKVVGADTRNYDVGFLSHQAGLLFDDPSSQLLAATVEDELAFGLENFGVPREEMLERVKRYIKACRLEGYEGRSPHSLSGGEQQACALAAVLAMQPGIILLDEPTANIDPLGTRHVYDLIKELARTGKYAIILTTNKLEDVADWVDRLVIMSQGAIFLEGKPYDILQSPDEILKVGMKPPQITELFYDLKTKYNVHVETLPVMLEEAIKSMTHILQRRKTQVKGTKGPVSEYSSKKCVIDIRNVHFAYSKGAPEALKGVSAKIYEGEFVGIIGQNGSGKTTLMKQFNGLLLPTSGDIITYGKNTKEVETADLANDIAYVFQNPDHQLFSTKVSEELAYAPRNLGVPENEIEKRVKSALADVKLSEDYLDLPPLSLSTSEKQRVAIASVLTMEPKILVVDEPTTGQGPQARRALMDLTKEFNKNGKTIIVVTHDMELTAEYTHRCIVLKHGQLLCDSTTREVFSQPEMLASTYLQAPQITRFGQALTDYGIPPDIMNIDEMCGVVSELTGGK